MSKKHNHAAAPAVPPGTQVAKNIEGSTEGVYVEPVAATPAPGTPEFTEAADAALFGGDYQEVTMPAAASQDELDSLLGGDAPDDAELDEALGDDFGKTFPAEPAEPVAVTMGHDGKRSDA